MSGANHNGQSTRKRRRRNKSVSPTLVLNHKKSALHDNDSKLSKQDFANLFKLIKEGKIYTACHQADGGVKSIAIVNNKYKMARIVRNEDGSLDQLTAEDLIKA
eukprot:962254_1